MSRNSSVKLKLNKILDEIEEAEISIHIVKGKWLDLYGCRFLPHANIIGQTIRMHGGWISLGGDGRRMYRRRAQVASD
jgi:hypothetical protein